MSELEKIKQEIDEYRAKPLLTDNEKKILEFLYRIIEIIKNKKYGKK